VSAACGGAHAATRGRVWRVSRAWHAMVASKTQGAPPCAVTVVSCTSVSRFLRVTLVALGRPSHREPWWRPPHKGARPVRSRWVPCTAARHTSVPPPTARRRLQRTRRPPPAAYTPPTSRRRLQRVRCACGVHAAHRLQRTRVPCTAARAEARGSALSPLQEM
jgi:hypothetical protein